MQAKETWDKSGVASIRQRIEEPEKTVTREFNFQQKTMKTMTDRRIGTVTSFTEKFETVDDGLVRVAWEELRRAGVPDDLDYRHEPSIKARHHNADVVADIFKKPRARDTVAPSKASFRKRS